MLPSRTGQTLALVTIFRTTQSLPGRSPHHRVGSLMAAQNYLAGAIDCHVHACPHLSARSVDVFQAVRAAADAGMRAIGLMDNFQNSSGYAALARRELGHLGVDVFGGIILQPSAGGISLEAAKTALGYDYGNGGARFVSLPTHHTRHVATQEDRSPAFLETTFSVPENGRISDTVLAIMDLCAEHNVVFDCGHVSAAEAVTLCQEAVERGVARLRTHCTDYSLDAIAAITGTGAYAEFSYFPLTNATSVRMPHADGEMHTIKGVSLAELTPRISAAGDKAILSSDCGIALLPPPVEGLRQFLAMLEKEGFCAQALTRMTSTNPAALFGIALGQTSS